jgi:hypothetical protein
MDEPSLRRVACQGAPRDLGLEQGGVARDAIRSDAAVVAGRPGVGRRLAAAWQALTVPRATGSLARDVACHFPHLDERLAGLATAAGIDRETALALLSSELRAGEDALIADAGHGAGGILEVALRSPLPATGLVLRRTRPDGGYANLTLTRPALPAALAGVNERGLAGAVVLLESPAPGDRWAASGALLLEGSIERLDDTEKALEWCERRPGGGRLRLLFSNASGTAGALEIDGEKRRRLPLSGRTGTGIQGARTWLRLDPGARTLEIWRGAQRVAHAALGSAS